MATTAADSPLTCNTGCFCSPVDPCTMCNTTYVPTAYPFEGACIPCSGTGCNQLCSSGFANGTCATCYNVSYYTATGNCTINPAGCALAQSYNPSNPSLVPGACLACSPGNSFVSSNMSCVQAPIVNCQNVTVSGTCTQCINGFTYNAATNVCDETVPNCAAYGPYGYCQNCSAGYLPNQTNPILQCNQCPGGSCPPLCATMAANLSCTSCTGNNYPGPMGVCIAMPPNCNAVLPNGICTSCVPNYYLSYINLCVPMMPGCYQEWRNGSCLSCMTGYLPNSVYVVTACYNCSVANCLTASANGVCSSCILGYALQPNNTCAITVPNCNYFVSPTQCGECNIGYLGPNMNSFSQCYPCPGGNCPANCGAMTSAGVCLQCVPTFYMAGNGSCLSMIPNCVSSTSTGQCLQCAQSYQPNNLSNITACTASFVIGCQTSNTQGTCTSCFPGFNYSSGGGCNPIVANCLTFNATTLQCIACQGGYLPPAGYPATTCSPCTSDGGVCPYFCVGYINGTCVMCMLGGYLSNGTCLALSYGCGTGNATGCLTCAPGYLPPIPPANPASPYVTCTACNVQYCTAANASGCVACAAGYVLEQGICAQNVTNCAYYVSGVCQYCNAGYLPTMSMEQCVACVGPCDPNCLTANTTGYCNDCLTGYYLAINASSNGIPYCAPLPEGCMFAALSGSCELCLSNFLPNTTSTTGFAQCFECSVPNCVTANASNVCQTCLQGFTLESGVCVELVSNCALYVNGLCWLCFNNYLPNNPNIITNCYLCPNSTCLTNCAAISQNGTCVSCAYGYYISNGACPAIPMANCAIGGPSSCSACFQGYAPTGLPITQCVATNVTDCTIVNAAGVCLNCTAGFTLQTVSGVQYCIENTQNCQYYNMSGFCIQCQPGYLLNGNNGVDCVPCPNNFCPLDCEYLEPFFDFCTQCVQGYYLNMDNNCVPAPFGCAQVDAQGTCLMCADYYVPDNPNNITQCLWCGVINCAVMLISNQSCVQCYQGYTLMGQNCVYTGWANEGMTPSSRAGVAVPVFFLSLAVVLMIVFIILIKKNICAGGVGRRGLGRRAHAQMHDPISDTVSH